MCLALPARVVQLLDNDQALVELGGVRKAVSLALTPEAREGDYVIVHVGHAIGLIDAEEAERTLALFAELEASGHGNGVLSADELAALPDAPPDTAASAQTLPEPNA